MSERSLPAVLLKVYGTIVLIIADYVNISIARIPVSGICVIIAVPFPYKVMAVKVICQGIIGVYPQLFVSLRALSAPPEP